MTSHFRVFPLRRLGLGVVLWMAALAVGTPTAVVATMRSDLYQATAPLADRSEASQAAAFQAAMRTVLVRVTGRRTAGQDPALASLVAEARRYVQQYRAVPDRQLRVVFDGAAIERWLVQNGQPIWGPERPVTFVWLALPTGPQTGTVVSQEVASDVKTAIEAEAAARGTPLLWPSGAELQSNRVDFTAVNGQAAASLAELGRRLGGEGVLIGRAAAAGAGANIRWVFVFQDRSSELSGPLEGVDGAADHYAALFSATGSPAPLDIEVEGVADLAAYAKLQHQLESVSIVSHVSLQSMSGDLAAFRLTARGGAVSLQRALALGGTLEPVAGVVGGPLRFRLRP